MRETGESGYGLYVIVDHADGFATLYAHCSSISAKVGDKVTCGEQIAKVGQTGNATGPHLHLELWHQRRGARSCRLSDAVSRIQVRDGFLVLMAALWCADESGVLPIFLLAAAVHECGPPFRHSAVRRHGARPVPDRPAALSCGAACRRRRFRALPSCLAGPAASFALTALANPLGRVPACRRECPARAVQPAARAPARRRHALRHLTDGRFTRLLNGIAGVSVLVLLAGGVLLWKSGFGGWLFLAGLMVAVSFAHT